MQSQSTAIDTHGDDLFPQRSATWIVALWGALGAAFGSALAFAIFETHYQKHWFGLLLAVTWVMIWKRFVEPSIEEKLSVSRTHGHHPAMVAKPWTGAWLAPLILSALLAVSVVVWETIAELIHSHARDNSTAFLQELIGPAATVFFIVSGWTLGMRRQKPQAVLYGSMAGLLVPTIVFACIGLPSYGASIPIGFFALWLFTAFFWCLAGFLGGWIVTDRRQSNPLAAIAVCLFVLVAVWNIGLDAVALHIPNTPAVNILFSALLNSLRIFGWMGGLFLCPWSPALLGTENLAIKNGKTQNVRLLESGVETDIGPSAPSGSYYAALANPVADHHSMAVISKSG